MAESIVSFAIEKLSAFVIAEAELLGSLSGDVRALGKEMATIKEVLKDADRKAEEDDTINEWLRQVREIGYEIEDVVDEYVLLKEQRQKLQNQSFHHSSEKHELFLMITRLWKWLGKAVTCVSELKPKHELASKIKEIKAELVEISSRRDRYQFILTTDNSNEHSQSPQDPRVSSLFMDDSELFGIEDHKAEIIKWLNLEEQQNNMVECSRSVIAVVGMGGIGKTTLVRKVYKDKDVRRCFNFYAWVSVSQTYEWRDLLRSIFKQVHAQPSLQVDTADELTIIDELRNHLKDERYIIIFDDVWDAELWRFVKVALPSNNKSSRILMTTRDKNIALHWMASSEGHYVYDLKPLPQEVAWDLFCHTIFGNKKCPPELEQLSLEMVKKCDGLPLAIVAIAGLLCNKNKVYSEWNKVHNSLSFELGSNRHFSSATKILLLSYHELPYYLKPCFLYFGMLPEAYSIDCIRLVRIWVAEGFIPNQRGKTLEEVAEEYLNELVNRNLVQVTIVEGLITKRMTLCRVHGILREMVILPKLDNLCFCQVLSQDNVPPTNKLFRRLSIHNDFVHANTTLNVSEISNPSVRSILWFVHPRTLPHLSVRSLLKVSGLLKVLDLEDAPIDHIPEDLGNFQHLQYLSLKNTNVKVIPESIGKLWNLQTLNLKCCFVVELPREIKQCYKLRHLLTFRVVDKSKQGVKIHDGVLENFKELQKLAYVETDRTHLIEALQQVKQLRRLAITKLKKEQGKALCHVIEEMKHLRSLCIVSIDCDEILDLQYIEKSSLPLESLYLEGSLEKLPNWVTKLNNLARLHLAFSRLEDDPLKYLQVLPNLVRLTLKDAYVGEILDFGLNKFCKLELLELVKLQKLTSLVGVTLPALRDANVEGCPLLRNIPPLIFEFVAHKVKEAIRVQMYVQKAAFQFIDAALGKK